MMSSQNLHDVTDEIYHRIYRLIKRKLSPHTIAATLHLPVRTVLAVINRLERTEKQFQEHSTVGNETTSIATEFLDIYFYPKTRYAIIDLVGSFSDNQIAQVQSEVSKAMESNWKAVAIRMSDVTSLSESATRLLLSIKDDFNNLGRFFALLDPATAIESTLSKNDIEKQIPVFGTERAFEEAAFSKKSQKYSRHGAQSDT